MAKCEFCGQEAGFLRKRHSECRAKHDDGNWRITNMGRRAALASAELATFKAQAKLVARESFVDEAALRSLIIASWEQAVTTALEDGCLSQEEEAALNAYRDCFALSQQELDRSGSYSSVVKAGVIRDLLGGNLPRRVTIEGPVPFNLQRGESLLWLFNNVAYYEERTRTTYVGGSHGVSVRVAKGVYYRLGAFKGNPVVTAQTLHVATGVLGFTEKHVYFAGGNKAFRVAYKKIVSFTPFSDGIGLQRDALTAKPQIFVTGDGWFTYNLVSNLAQRSLA